MHCPFCDIVVGDAPATIVYDDERVIAFQDSNPVAPVHILIIPREHISGPLAVDDSNETVIGHMVAVAAHLARDQDMDGSGYRLVLNQGREGGQSVFHIHLHLLGGRHMSWPPG